MARVMLGGTDALRGVGVYACVECFVALAAAFSLPHSSHAGA